MAVDVWNSFIKLDEFGFSGIGITEEDLTTPETVLQLGYLSNRIDLITGVSGLKFED